MARSMREMELFARQKGLSMAHLGLLVRLHYHEAYTISEISEHLGITTAASSQMVQRLFEQSLIKREEDPVDRRIKRISLTDTGKALVNEVITLRRKWMEAVESALSPSEREEIAHTLSNLNAAIKHIDILNDE